jgi:hypothetical protein
MSSEKRPLIRNAYIDPVTLEGLVKNTAPYLFEELKPDGNRPEFEYIEILNNPKADLETDLWNYYEFCVASHFATVGTFVPTDVDLSIREKLWKNAHSIQTFEPLWRTVQRFHSWSEAPVSKRFVVTKSGKKLSGHQGEWFSIAMGAYGCAQKNAQELIPEIRESIEAQLKEHEEALAELRTELLDRQNGEALKNYLAGVAAVAHNLGDLDRMFESWSIGDNDVLKRRVFRSGHEDARQPRAIFIEAGKVYQSLLANENHRHFALREPKGLRKSPDFLLTFGPFLDDWGKNLVTHGFQTGVLTELDLREVAEALIKGWQKLNAKSIYHSQGYARALYGIASALGGDRGFARGKAELEDLLPPLVRKGMLEGGIRTLFTVNQQQFEQQLLRKTLAFL